MSYAAKKTEAHFKQAFEGFDQQQRPQDDQVGDIIINKKQAKPKKGGEKVGEYIDFEEID